jgi:hypothetical protein
MGMYSQRVTYRCLQPEGCISVFTARGVHIGVYSQGVHMCVHRPKGMYGYVQPEGYIWVCIARWVRKHVCTARGYR